MNEKPKTFQTGSYRLMDFKACDKIVVGDAAAAATFSSQFHSFRSCVNLFGV